jgi:hypothetical protein
MTNASTPHRSRKTTSRIPSKSLLLRRNWMLEFKADLWRSFSYIHGIRAWDDQRLAYPSWRIYGNVVTETRHRSNALAHRPPFRLSLGSALKRRATHAHTTQHRRFARNALFHASPSGSLTTVATTAPNIVVF